MDGWMDAWMHGCMDAWMHGCMHKSDNLFLLFGFLLFERTG